jgi:uncharacterized membrane protein
MSATVVAPTWPRNALLHAGPWRFAHVVQHVDAGPTLQWLLKRNCSLTPVQLFGSYALLCLVSLAIALGFAWQGAVAILAFAGLELVLVGVALLVYARHAADQERITLAGDALTVEHCHGSQIERMQFRAGWVRVEPQAGEGSLVELSGDGRQSCVGRYLRPELREPLARELRAALRVQSQEISSFQTGGVK